MERFRQRVALVLLVAALLLFVAFHFLPIYHSGTVGGWMYWSGLWRVITHPPYFIKHPAILLQPVSFLNCSLIIVASPFLTHVWGKSRLAWGFATVFSGFAAITDGLLRFFFFYFGTFSYMGFGGWCLFFASLVNFAGLLLARGKAPGSIEALSTVEDLHPPSR